MHFTQYWQHFQNNSPLVVNYFHYALSVFWIYLDGTTNWQVVSNFRHCPVGLGDHWISILASLDHENKIIVIKWLFCGTLTLNDRKQVEREGEWHAAKGPRPGLDSGAAAEDEVSAHGTPTLHTELTGTPILIILMVKMFMKTLISSWHSFSIQLFWDHFPLPRKNTITYKKTMAQQINKWMWLIHVSTPSNSQQLKMIVISCVSSQHKKMCCPTSETECEETKKLYRRKGHTTLHIWK